MSALSKDELKSAADNLDLECLEDEVRESFKYLGDDEVKELIEEYKKFLCIKVFSKDIDLPYRCSPSAVIDQVWHAHILETESYISTCETLGVNYIHHSSKHASDPEWEKEARREVTKTTYKLLYRTSPPEDYWGEVKVEKAAHQENQGEKESIVYHENVEKDVVFNSSKNKQPKIRQRKLAELGLTVGPKKNLMLKEKVVLYVKHIQTSYVNTQPGKTIKVKDVNLYINVEKLKEKIQVLEGIPPDQQRLVYGGRQLEEGRTLKQYGISNLSTLYLILRLAGC